MTEVIKEINLDMDGTFANLYDVPNWLPKLQAEDPTPYLEAKPLVNMNILARRLNALQKKGFKIRIISWGAKFATPSYDKAIEIAKKKWIAKHLASVKFDEICVAHYGTPKQTLGKGYLWDDEKPNRDAWEGKAFDEKNLLENLKELIENS